MRKLLLLLLLPCFATLLLTVLLAATAGEAKEEELLSPDSELKAAISFADGQADLWEKSQGRTGIPPEALPYLMFFTTYDVPEKLLKDTEVSLQFALNHLQSVKSYGNIEKAHRVTDHPSLWWIDIRDFGWDIEQREAASKLEPFFADPVVDHKVYNYARARAGNMMFRADWFIYNALDVTKQDDREEKNILYYLLIYGIDKAPKDAKEFQDFWKVDIKTIRVENVEKGAIVDHGDSGVSKHARQIRRGRTIFGYYWETRDIKAYEQRRDFLEDLFANNWDASEYIASTKNGFQVYMLSNGIKQGLKRVETADPGIVEDRSDPVEHRLRTSKSCISCHAIGINPASNEVRDLIQAGGDLRTYDFKLKQALKSFYLGNINSLVEQDNKIFEEAVKEATGQDPLKATQSYLNVYDWYREKVTPEQAAKEVGLTLKEYRDKIRPTATGRLTQLHRGKPIPREVWDSLEVGGYIQSQLLIKKIDLKAPIKPVEQKPKMEKAEKAGEAGEEWLTVTSQKPAPLQDFDNGNTALTYLPRLTRCKILRRYPGHPEWFFVRPYGKEIEGWIHADYVTLDAERGSP